MKTKYIIAVISALLIISVFPLTAQDWPQFLGPNRNHTTSQKGLLKSWPESGPELLWSTELGTGFGGPVIKDGKVYLLDRDDEIGDMMRCFSLQTGEELWNFSYESPGAVPYPGSRSVPVVDDKYVYSCGLNGDLYCIDIKTHQPVWNKNVWTDFGGEKIPMWAIAQCPVIYGNLLIIASQAPQAGVVAYNKLTGDVAWKTSNLGNTSYVSPKIVKIHGEDQVVWIASSTNRYTDKDAPLTKGNVVGIDPETGEILWNYSDWECVISVPCPVEAGDNKLLVVGGYDRGATMIQVNKKGDGTFDVSELFTTLEFGDQTKPPLLHDGYFYAMFRTNQKRDGMVCMDMNGKLMWKTARNPDFDRGSMILVDGLILATDGLNSLYLIEPDPAGFKQISKAKMFAGGQNWAPIALADGKLLIRDQNKMVCVKVAQ